MNLGFLTSANRLVYLLVAGIAILVFLTIILVLRSFGGSGEPITLQFWGVFDTRASFERTIREFQGLYPNVKIQYTQLNYEDYERALIDKLAAGQGPDILMIHNTWLPKHGDKLMPLDESWRDVNDKPLMTMRDFGSTFVDVAAEDLVLNGRIYSLPLYVDTLALYYNKDLLNGAGLTRPPVTWDDFNTAVEKLTRLDSSGNIVQSGAAIGTARNINRSTDILMSLMIQSGVQMTNPENTSATFTRSVDNQRIGEIALQYYTDFTKPEKRTYSWNDAQHYSIDAFAEGATAMMFNYSHQIPLLRAKSPRLNFSVAPIPQLSSSDPRTFPNYWAPAVTSSSLHPKESWQFISFLASKDQAAIYLGETNRPAARRDLIDLQRSDPELGVFAEQALAAKSWFQVDNVATEGIFADMIEDVNFGRLSVRDALKNAESRINVLMQSR